MIKINIPESFRTHEELKGLETFFEEANEKLQDKRNIVTLNGQFIEIRAATWKERFCSWIRLKPENIRLSTIKQTLSSIATNGGHGYSFDKREFRLLKFSLNIVSPRVINGPATKNNLWITSKEGAVFETSSYYLQKIPFFISFLNAKDRFFSEGEECTRVDLKNCDFATSKTIRLFLSHYSAGGIKEELNFKELLALAQFADFMGDADLYRDVIVALINFVKSLKLRYLVPNIIDITMNPLVYDQSKDYYKGQLIKNMNFLYYEVTNLIRFFDLECEFVNSSYAPIQYYLGDYYLGHCDDSKKALGFYQLAASQKYSPALTVLGKAYEFGLFGVAKDQNKAIEFYEESILDGNSDNDPERQYWLGECYLNGRGVKKNPEVGVDWYLRAMKNGSQRAKETLISIFNKKLPENSYTLSQVVDFLETFATPKHFSELEDSQLIKNLISKFKLHEVLENTEQNIIQYLLAECYEKGIGVEENSEKAFELYMKVAFAILKKPS